MSTAGDDKTGAKLLAGGLSCMMISALLNPMDVIKIRLQTQNQLKSQTPAVYKGFFNTLIKTFREEGYRRGLMRGITPSMLREGSYSSIRMGCYDFFKDIFSDAAHKDHVTLIQKVLAGASSGAVGATLANPTDLVKIRFQSYTPTKPNPYQNTFHAFVTIFKTEGGLRALYKGSTANVMRAAVLTGSQLPAYDHSKRWMLRHGLPDDTRTHLAASFIAGLVTATTTIPVDVIKSRVMADGAGLYKNPVDCLIKTVSNEGPRALLKGWLPNWGRLGPHFILSIPLYEYLRTQFGAGTI